MSARDAGGSANAQARDTAGGRATLAFATAGAVIGATNTGVNFFLLVYYNQVHGLDASLAGLALALALLVDAVADPAIGVLSDRWRSRLGRRHPFLLAAILPMTASYIAIWFPPSDGQAALFAWLLGFCILLRVSLSLFDIPTNALIAELSSDYDRRTRWSSAKTCFNWSTANLVGIATYAIWLADAPGAAPGSGLLNRGGYQGAGIVIGGVALLLAALVPLLLADRIAQLRQLTPPSAANVAQLARQLIETYGNRSVLFLLASAMFFAAGVGATQALWVYFLSYFWGLSAAQVNAVQLAYLVAAVVAWLALPRLAAGRDKRRLALALSALFWVQDVLPIALRLVGLMPANGDPALPPVLVAFGFLDGLLFNMVVALALSMLTDAVEDNLERTGRREEGVVLAGQTLITKASTALGTVLGAGVLSAVHFPVGIAPAALPAEVAQRLGLAFVALMWLLGVVSTLALLGYRITRASHAETLARLLQRETRGTPP